MTATCSACTLTPRSSAPAWWCARRLKPSCRCELMWVSLRFTAGLALRAKHHLQVDDQGCECTSCRGLMQLRGQSTEQAAGRHPHQSTTAADLLLAGRSLSLLSWCVTSQPGLPRARWPDSCLICSAWYQMSLMSLTSLASGTSTCTAGGKGRDAWCSDKTQLWACPGPVRAADD